MILALKSLVRIVNHLDSAYENAVVLYSEECHGQLEEAFRDEAIEWFHGLQRMKGQQNQIERDLDDEAKLGSITQHEEAAERIHTFLKRSAEAFQKMLGPAYSMALN